MKKDDVLNLCIWFLMLSVIISNFIWGFPEQEEEYAGENTVLLRTNAVYIYPPTYAYNLATYYDGDIYLVPSLIRFSQSLTFDKVLMTMREPRQPGFCSFTMHLPKQVTFILAGQTSEELIHDCFKNYTLVRSWKNTYKDTWGERVEDITIFQYEVVVDGGG